MRWAVHCVVARGAASAAATHQFVRNIDGSVLRELAPLYGCLRVHLLLFAHRRPVHPAKEFRRGSGITSPPQKPAPLKHVQLSRKE